MLLFISKHINVYNAHIIVFSNRHALLLYSKNICNLKPYKEMSTFIYFSLVGVDSAMSEQGPQEREEEV